MTLSTQEDIYLRDGLNAIQEYKQENLRKGIDEVISALDGNLHFKGTAKNFKSKVLEFANIGKKNKKSVLRFLNKNQYTKKALEFADLYAKENPEEISKIIQEVESEAGIKLTDIGFDRTFYDNLLFSLQKEGMVGKNGGLKLIADTLMDHLEGVTYSFSNLFGDESVKELTLNEIGEFVSSELKITPAEIKESYKRNDFNGVLKYVLDNAVINGSHHLESILTELEEEGIEHGLTPGRVVDIYNKGGFLNRGGIVETAGKIALENVSGSEKYLYMGILGVALNNKKEKLKEQFKNSHSFGVSSDEIDKFVYKSMIKGIQQVVMLSELPEELSKENLINISEKNGLLGDNGLFSYLSQNSSTIFENARMMELVGEEDIKFFSDYALKTSKIKSLKDVFKINTTRANYENLAVNIAKKAEEIGIKPVELLREPQYIAQRKETIDASYGSVDKLYSKTYSQLSTIVPMVDKALKEIQKGDIDTDELIDEVSSMRPDNKFLGKAFDAVVSKYLKRTIVQRITDYLTLTKGLVEQQIEFGKNELQAYDNLKSL